MGIGGGMTKKMLVFFDPERPSSKSSDCLVPFVGHDGDITLFGLKSNQEVRKGIVVLAGKEVSNNDLFAKLIDAGHKIDDVDATLARLYSFLEAVDGLRIGNIVELQPIAESPGFKLKKLAGSPPKSSRELPG